MMPSVIVVLHIHRGLGLGAMDQQLGLHKLGGK